MFARLQSQVLFVVGYLPTFVVRRLTQSSPFGTRVHHAESAWDL
ncbi:hypothetical protein [Streptomyces sp. GbtcB6]|nr:hypothetical protein [Streptomyces sp. GbtcB6]